MIIPFYSFIYEFMFHHASELFFNLGCLGCTFEGYFLNILLGSRKKKTDPQLESVAAPGCIDLQATCSQLWFVHFLFGADQFKSAISLGQMMMIRVSSWIHWNTSFRRMSASPMDLDVVRTLSWWPVSPTSPGISRNLQDMLLCW